jgi:Large polyvalent protein associated domain 38/ADP-Ribosyltransferase in polyvalent proteins
MAKEFSLDEAFGPPKDRKEKREISLAEAFGPPPERTKTEAVTDIAAPFVAGIGSLLKFPGQVYGLTTGAIKNEDFSKTGLQGIGTDIEDWAKKQYSEKLKYEQAETERKVAEAEKEGQIKALTTSLGEVVSSPAQLPAFIAEQAAMAIPTAIISSIPGVGPAAALELRTAIAAASKLAKGTAAREAADAAVKLAAENAAKSQVARRTTAALGTQAVQQGADIGEGSFQEIKDYLMREKKMSEEQASNEALNLARASGLTGAGVSLLAQKLPGAKAFEKALAGEKLGTGRLMGAATGALKNIPDELAEEVGGKLAQNVALQQVNPEQSLTAGLGSTAAQAALGATAIGGGAGALAGGKPAVSKEELQAAEDLKRRQELTEKARAEREEIARQLDVTKNPVGALTPADLGPVLTQYVEKHRASTGKPALTEYNLEDVIDALPAKERAALSAGNNDALNALIAAKTGHTTEAYTADDITNLAKEKNIDVTTQGFDDFLKRSTGINDPALMSQPQLHAAVTSLQKLPTFKQTQSLPEGSNATRYSDEQYAKAIEGLNTAMDNVGADELGFKQATSAVEKATGLKFSAVNDLLNDATRKGDILTGDKKVSIPSRAMPSGYNVEEQIGEEEERADSYDIMQGDQKIRSMDTQEQADAHVEKLNRIAEAELKKTQEGLKAQDDKITKSENELHKLELNGMANTPEYAQAEAAHQAVLDAAMPEIALLKAQEEAYSKPITVVPVGTKKIKPKTYAVRKGEQTIKEAADRAAAEEEIFKDLTDQELQDLSKKRSPALLERVNAEIQRRAAEPKPEPKKLTPELEQQRKVLEQTLPKLLEKFGLQDVGLKIMDAIDNDAEGSYAAKVIQIALGIDQPVRVLRHESLHALKALGFFTPQQWAVLEREAENKWVDKYLKSVIVEVGGQRMTRYEAYANGVKDAKGEYILKPLTKEGLLEEAIADAFADFDVNKAPPGMLTALLNKLRNFFSTLKSFLNDQGYEKAEDIFTKIEKGELKATQPVTEGGEAKLSVSPVSEQRSYKLDIEREKRKMAKSVSLTEQEAASIIDDANKLGLSEDKVKEIIKTVKDDKKRYPATQGWAPLTVIGIDSKVDDNGNVVEGSETPKYAPIAYAYNVPPGSTKAPNKVDQAWLGKVTSKFQNLVEDLYKRAEKGDVNAKNIIAHQTWYKNVAKTLRQEYGGFGDTLADLLGATSPNTPVDTNWRFSVEIMRRFVRGDFDADMKKFVEFLDTGESPSKFPAQNKIRQITGKLYGMNSTNAMLALADMWRAIKPGQAPKARNFALNLIGQSDMATIDVWAARMLRRAANMVKGADFPRIPPPAEQGVSGTWNADATKVTGAFGFGADVMQKVSDNLAKKGIIVAPPDLQAIAWFAEKELWGKKGWTTKTGEGGSFEENIEGQPTERYIAGHSVQQGSEKPAKDTVVQAQNQVSRLLSKDPGVLAFRVEQTAGLYGGEVEDSFDTEVVVDKGKFDPTELVKKLATISKENNQWDIFVSKVVDPKAETNLNARPGVEIYFKTPQDMAKIMPILQRFTSRGQDGFTLAVDPRVNEGSEQYMGVRLQYVPEISMRWDDDLRQQLLVPSELKKVMDEKRELLNDIIADVADMDGVAYASMVDYDTVVIGKENYSDYINGKTSGRDQTAGKNPWFGEPLRDHVERAVTRFEGKQGPAAQGNVPSVGEEPSQKLSLRTAYPTAEEAESAAYRKAPPITEAFKRWFGKSKVVEEGRPMVMYHASPADFNTFYDYKPIFISPDPKEAEFFGRFHYYGDERAKKPIKIYPLWVRAENSFDFENPKHVDRIHNALVKEIGEDFITEQSRQRLASGDWSYVEDESVQKAIKDAGFDSFYVQEGDTKNLAVFGANQVKSATGNSGEFGETKDMRYSLRPFNPDELPQNKQSYILPSDTLLYHGAHETRAKEIEATGKILISRSPIKTNSGTLDEGGLVFFGGEDTARRYANSEADPMAAKAARDRGEIRNPGVVFETATDRPYKLMNKNYRLSQKEADDLNRVLGIPDYKRLRKGDSADIAAYRALMNSKTVESYKTNKGEMVVAWPKIFETLGYDGFFDDFAVALPADNGIRLVGEGGKMQRFSLRVAEDIKQMPNGLNAYQSITEKTTAREEEGFINRILKAISPEGRASFRQKAINRYEGQSANDKRIADMMGGIELLADASSEAAALQSDTAAGIAAAAMGYGDSAGGVPVYEKGYTTISDLNGTVKGLTEILRPLAVHGDPFIYRAYQFYAGVKRGTRLMADGKEKLFDKADIQYAKDLEQLYPEFKTVQQEWTKYNDGLVDYMVKTGVLTAEKGRLFKKYGDYVPFYRQLEGEETIGPNIFQSMSGVKQPKKIKGGEAPLADFLETVVRNTQAAIQAGTKNVAGERAIQQALFLGTASKLPQVSSAPNTVTILENGVPTSYAVADKLLYDSMQSLHLPEMPFLGILSAPANLLRNMVTKDPGFMLANLMRDSLSAYVTSGANMTPLIDTFSNFGKVMAGRSPEFQALINAGVIGGYEFSRGVPSSGEALAKDLRKKTGTQAGLEGKLKPITSLWDFLEKGTEASDAATRIAVYKDVMNRTGNEAEAIRQALEVMNFNRKGSSPIIRVVTAAIPFLNARIQGLDVFYRAGFAPTPEGVNKTDRQKEVQKNLFIRAATLVALSSMYWFMMKDDDEYKKQEQEVKDNNWLLPGLGVRIPTPFEVGVLFKVVPERLCAYFFGSDTGEDLAKSMERALRSTFAINYIPQTVLPLVEATTNYSYFTMRPIVGQGMEGVRPGLQTGPGTTKIAETVGKAINQSPILIDHIIQGYTGTMGMYLVNAVDSVIDVASEVQKPALRPDQYPIVKRFLMNPEAKGTVSAYFELKAAVDETVRTMNMLEKQGRGEELSEFMQGKHRVFGMSNAKLYGIKDYISSVDKNMKTLQDAAQKIRASKMPPDEKQKALSQINMAEIGLTKSVFSVRGNL